MRIAMLLLSALLAACGAPQPPVLVTEVEITMPIPGRHMSAGFLVVTNTTRAPVRITSVNSPQFDSVEIHETTVTDGISRMHALDELIVPARSSTRLERGGKHLMLMRPRNLEDSVTLRFLSDDTLVVTVDYSFPPQEESR